MKKRIAKLPKTFAFDKLIYFEGKYDWRMVWPIAIINFNITYTMEEAIGDQKEI
jgi:hypothetical protein